MARNNPPRIAVLALVWAFSGQLATPLQAFCGGAYTFSAGGGCPANHYVPENLMRWGERAEFDRESRFLRDLGCWLDGEAKLGRIVCDVNGEEIVYVWERQGPPDPVLLFVPAAGWQTASETGTVEAEF